MVMSVGPLAAALTGVPAGRLADAFGAHRVTIIGLIGIAAGALNLCLIPATPGIVGYIAPIVAMTAGYALFQTANNTSVMRDIPADQRGVMSGMLNLSRNLGLISGASVMGAVFALASGTTDITTASPLAVATALWITFGLAAMLIVAALVIAFASRVLATLLSLPSSPSREKFVAPEPAKLILPSGLGRRWGSDLADEQSERKSHRLRWWLGRVPSRKMIVDCHASQTVDKGARGKHKMIEIQTLGQLPPITCHG